MVYRNSFLNVASIQIEPRIAEGIYFLELQTESYRAVRKVVRIR